MADDEFEEKVGPHDNVYEGVGISTQNMRAYKKLIATFGLYSSEDNQTFNLNMLSHLHELIANDRIPRYDLKNPSGLLLGYACVDGGSGTGMDVVIVDTVSKIGQTVTNAYVHPISKIDIIRYGYFMQRIIKNNPSALY